VSQWHERHPWNEPRWLTYSDFHQPKGTHRPHAAKLQSGGGLEVLKHVREQGCHWDARHAVERQERGHLEVLKWARANGCEWNQSTCSGAARGGHLEVLKWAWGNGCPWDCGGPTLAVPACNRPARISSHARCSSSKMIGHRAGHKKKRDAYLSRLLLTLLRRDTARERTRK